jgi:hypothetical protein
LRKAINELVVEDIAGADEIEQRGDMPLKAKVGS